MGRYICMLLLLNVVFCSGCLGRKVRVVDSATGLPLPGVEVGAMPSGIFLLGFPVPDKVRTDKDGIAVLRNRRLDASNLWMDGFEHQIIPLDTLVREKEITQGPVRLEYAGLTYGWPFRDPSLLWRKGHSQPLPVESAQ